jgi:hypothetical protein
VGRSPTLLPHIAYSVPEPPVSHGVLMDKMALPETDFYASENIAHYLNCTGGNLAHSALLTQLAISGLVWLVCLVAAVRGGKARPSWRVAAGATAVSALVSCWLPAASVAAWVFWYVADADALRLDLFEHGIAGIPVAALLTRVAITLVVFRGMMCRRAEGASGEGAGVPRCGRGRKIAWVVLGVVLVGLWSWPVTYTWVRLVLPSLPQ